MCHLAILATSEAPAEKQKKNKKNKKQANLQTLPLIKIKNARSTGSQMSFTVSLRAACSVSSDAATARCLFCLRLFTPVVTCNHRRKKLGMPYFSTDSRTGAPARHFPPPHVSFHRGEKYEKQ